MGFSSLIEGISGSGLPFFEACDSIFSRLTLCISSELIRWWMIPLLFALKFQRRDLASILMTTYENWVVVKSPHLYLKILWEILLLGKDYSYLMVAVFCNSVLYFSGLLDPRLGPTDQGVPCRTCGLNYINCPGHPGHIELDVPVSIKISCWSVISCLIHHV